MVIKVQGMRWPRIKARERKPSPPEKPRIPLRSRMTQLRQGKQRPKTFLPFNRARKKSLLLWPRPKAGVNRIRFLVRQSLGLTCFLALIAEHLVVRRRGVHQAFPPLLLSHRRYHPYWLYCCWNKIVDQAFPILIADTVHIGSIAARTRLWIYHSYVLSLLQLVLETSLPKPLCV